MQHLNLVRYVERFEREAAISGSFRNKLGKYELMFLERVWGPAFAYDYEGLVAEYPLIDFKGGRRFVDFVFTRHGTRLVVEIDGFTTHARDITPGEFNDHLERQNELMLAGWIILRFSAWQVEHHPVRCQHWLKQAIGHWWSIQQGAAPIKYGRSASIRLFIWP